MAIFKDTEFMYDVLGTLFNNLMADPGFDEKFKKAGIVIRFIINDPEGESWCLKDGTVVLGKSEGKATVTMTLSGDSCHQFWMKELSMPIALAKGKIKAKGPMPKVLKLLPLLKPAYEMYPGIAKEKGLQI
ncbi:MAG: SCP2 sterol-binding domain-containing protein [Proteobacteria bacterium]|nr:SCP2 sterol-binding domain-containing protein [Pseudomonadota bacterium]